MSIQTIKIGEAGTILVDADALKDMPDVSAYIWNYGLKQMLNDVHASETKKVTPDDATRAANKRTLVEKKLASLMAGEVAQERVGGGSSVERESFRIAEGEVREMLRKAGKKLPSGDAEAKAKRVELIGKYLAKHVERIRPIAEERLAEAKTGEVDEDILAMLEG